MRTEKGREDGLAVAGKRWEKAKQQVREEPLGDF